MVAGGRRVAAVAGALQQGVGYGELVSGDPRQTTAQAQRDAFGLIRGRR